MVPVQLWPVQESRNGCRNPGKASGWESLSYKSGFPRELRCRSADEERGRNQSGKQKYLKLI